MKIDNVILASNSNPKYLDFWPIVSNAWENLGINPYLFYIGKEKFEDNRIINFNIEELNSSFVSQNIRLLAPALFPDKVSIISDIDNMPLSVNYYQKNIEGVNKDSFVVYRPDAASSDMISIMWNAALGSTWGEIFNIKSEPDILRTLRSWCPEDYEVEGTNWYFDQVKLRDSVENFRKSNPDRVTELNDKATGFLRLNRIDMGFSFNKFYNKENQYTDFHMPRPYKKYKKVIDKVYQLNFEEK